MVQRNSVTCSNDHGNTLIVEPIRRLASHVFPRLPPVARFPELRTTYMFFPALSNGYTFSRARYRLNLFPRLERVTCLPVLGTGECCRTSGSGSGFPAFGSG